MKIRWDFVTNSSSTSFVMVCRGKPEREVFINAIGSAKGSALRPLFERLYEICTRKMINIDHPEETLGLPGGDSVLDVLRKYRLSSQRDRVGRALADGDNVWIGWLSSEDGDEIEIFFCCESFEVETAQLYFNALACYW